MNVENLKGKIDEKVNADLVKKIEEANKKEAYKRDCEAKIKSYAPQLKQLIEVGNYCIKNNIPITGKSYGGSMSENEYKKHFTTDGWFHFLGFYVNYNTKTIDGIGCAAGGACGNINFMVDQDGNICYGKNTGWWDRGVKSFLEGIDKFIARFEAYINSL